MKIEWKLDEQDGLDPIDTLGNITVTDGERTIQEESTYLDSWFDALITGLKGVQAGKSLTVEIVEEPEPLIFKPDRFGLQISYQNQSIYVNKVDEFIQTLKRAAKDFLLRVDQMTGAERNQLLNLIRDFVMNT